MSESHDLEPLRGFDDYRVRIGDEMRGRRATLGKSLLDVARELNIRAVLIDAIERADPETFEIQWVIPGHVRTYAKFLGMDPDETYRLFCRESGFVARPADVSGRPRRPEGRGLFKRIRKNRARRLSAKPAKSRPQKPREPLFDKQSMQTVTSSLFVLGLIAGIGYVGWTVYDEIDSIVQADAGEYPAPIEANDMYASVTSAAPDDRFTFRRDADLGSVTVKRTMGEIRPGEFGVYSEDSALTALVAPEPAAPVKEPVVETVAAVDRNQVILVPTRAAWMRLTKQDGTVIREETLAAGTELQVPESDEPLRLRAGNSGSVYFIVGGEVYGPAGTGTSVAKNVNLAAAAIRDRFDRVITDSVPREILDLGRFTQAVE